MNERIHVHACGKPRRKKLLHGKNRVSKHSVCLLEQTPVNRTSELRMASINADRTASMHLMKNSIWTGI